MKLFWCPRTRAVRAVWLLEEAGVDYEPVLINLGDPDSRDNEEFRKTSPMQKVPALQDGEARLAESGAIALYIADRYASGKLAPEIDDPARGEFLYWMFFTPAVVEPAMVEKFGNHPSNRGQHGWGDFDTMIEIFERGVEDGPWLLGEQFTAADCMVGSSAVFMRMFNILPDSAVLHAYADRCLERPAYQKALAFDAEHASVLETSTD
ncbi:MAG: glutathione S-transferase family protein [Gammaproteobacteria bacterium]|nr:glutathione S-transferase family protein [Gammaproteobacteria bacterium]